MRDEKRAEKCKKCPVLLNKFAGVVQWQNGSFPSCIRGFDSLRPLQYLADFRYISRHRSGTGTYGVAATFNVPLGITLIAKTPKFQGFSSTMRNYEDGARQLGEAAVQLATTVHSERDCAPMQVVLPHQFGLSERRVLEIPQLSQVAAP